MSSGNNILGCVSLVPEYNLLSFDELCSDKGMLILTDVRDCKKAARALNLKHTLNGPSMNHDLWPKGCFWTTYPYGEDEVLFNIHHTGKRSNLGKPICRTG